MINKRSALSLLHKHTKHLPNADGLKRHVIGVSEIAFEIAKKIKKKHPRLKIHPHKVKIAGLLHDIGKAKDGDHELNSVKILKKEGLSEIADIIIHSFVYELFLLEGKEKKEYLPKTLENKIIIYADYLFNDEKVTLKERIREIRERKKDEPKRIAALKLAESRLYDIEKEIKSLM